MFSELERSTHEDLNLLKCVKCGTYRNLRYYPLNKTLKMVSLSKKTKREIDYNKKEIYVTVCLRCRIEFDRWHQFNKNFKSKTYELVIYLAVLLGSIWLFYVNLLFMISSSIFVTFFIIFCLRRLKKKVNSMEYYPKNYFVYSKSHQLYVKPESHKTWMHLKDWIKDCIYERFYINECEGVSFLNQETFVFFKCVFCGAKVRDIDVKCFKCGKLLPLI